MILRLSASIYLDMERCYFKSVISRCSKINLYFLSHGGTTRHWLSNKDGFLFSIFMSFVLFGYRIRLSYRHIIVISIEKKIEFIQQPNFKANSLKNALVSVEDRRFYELCHWHNSPDSLWAAYKTVKWHSGSITHTCH